MSKHTHEDLGGAAASSSGWCLPCTRPPQALPRTGTGQSQVLAECFCACVKAVLVPKHTGGTRPHADALRELRARRQVVAPGLRLGWVTAAPAVIQKLVFHLHGISLGACSYTQARTRYPLPYPASLPYAYPLPYTASFPYASAHSSPLLHLSCTGPGRSWG